MVTFRERFYAAYNAVRPEAEMIYDMKKRIKAYKVAWEITKRCTADRILNGGQSDTGGMYTLIKDQLSDMLDELDNAIYIPGPWQIVVGNRRRKIFALIEQMDRERELLDVLYKLHNKHE